MQITSQAGLVSNTAEWQLEEGSIATPFEVRPIGLELALCQRYYETGTVYGWGYSNHSGSVRAGFNPFKVQKRTTPTISISSQIYQGCSSISTDDATIDSAAFDVQTATAGAMYWVDATFTASAEL